jgi:dihydroorotase-like cyclic amidohydrolase
VYCEDGIIKQVGLNLSVPSDARVVDATGKLVIPGMHSLSSFSS